jgi:uncharacterized membrane protein YphA (DoxX/SURF4 family)
VRNKQFGKEILKIKKMKIKFEAKDTKLNYTLNVVSRWIVGLVFLFSAFVKGVDPMGTMFKIQDYMSSWSLFGSSFEWAYPLAGVLAVTLICAEFLVGVLLIFNSLRILSAWLLALMMAFFTVTTFFDAVTNLVDDCGCFGDAIKLTNWETFWKNVVLDVFAVVIFYTRKLRYRRRLERDAIVMLVGIAAMIVFCVYNIKHEPVIDFRPWKMGNTMVEHQEPMNIIKFRSVADPNVVDTLKYKNGEWDNKWNDYFDETKWEVLGDAETTPEYIILADGFSMLAPDENGVLSLEQTLNILPDSNGVLFVTIYDLADVDEEEIQEVKNAVDKVRELNKEGREIRLVMLTSMGRISDSPLQNTQVWLSDNGIEGIRVNVLDIEGENNVYFADATAIKTIMRGNPGFMFMKNGVVVDKGRKVSDLDF